MEMFFFVLVLVAFVFYAISKNSSKSLPKANVNTGGHKNSSGTTDVRIPIIDGENEVEVTGESFCQNELVAIVGGKTEDGANFETNAFLQKELSNKYDPNAIMVSIADPSTNALLKVGYVNKRAAPVVGELIDEVVKERGLPVSVIGCRAVITGGWKRKNSEGSYGVKLYLP